MKTGNFKKIGLLLIVVAFIFDYVLEQYYAQKEKEKKQEQYEMRKRAEVYIKAFEHINPHLLENEGNNNINEDDQSISTNNMPDQINDRKFIADGVSFTVPEGWSLAGEDVKAAFEANLKKFGTTSISLKYLLYPTENIDTYGYPFISIEFEYLGINMENDENFIKYSESTKKSVKKIVSSFKTSMPDKFSQLESHAFYSDVEKREILWKSSNQIEGYGDITLIACFKMSESGVIRIGAYVPSNDMSSTLLALENLKNSLKNK